MFFQKNYREPGPGVDPDAPDKLGLPRFVEVLALHCGDIVKLNLLFMLSCIPVVTIPPAVYALYCVVWRMLTHRPVDCFYHYRKAFAAGFRRSYAVFLCVALPVALSAYGAGFYLRYAAQNPLMYLPFMFCTTVLLAAMLATAYVYGLLCRDPAHAGSVRNALRNGLLLGLGRPARGVAAALAVYGSLVVSALFFPLSAIYLLVLGFAAPVLLACFFVRLNLEQFFGPVRFEDAG